MVNVFVCEYMMKRMLQIKPEDWISFLFPALERIEIKDMPTEMVPKAESRMDNVTYINNEFISHIEPNGYLDKTLPARMLRYRADIWEYTMSRDLGTPSIKQVVIFFFEKHDNKLHNLEDDWDTEQTINFKYHTVKIWEVDKKDILERKLVGLYPLLPLTKRNDSEEDEKILVDTIQTIETVEDSALKVDLLSAMSILAGENFSSEIVKKYIRREQLMESALFKEWVSDFVDEAEQKGIEKGIEQEKLELTKEMLREGISTEKIMKVTRLLPNTIKIPTSGARHSERNVENRAIL